MQSSRRRNATLLALVLSAIGLLSQADGSSSQYDRSLTLFSPEGKLHQVEYAMNAVEHYGKPLVGVQGRDCCVVAMRKGLLDDALVDSSSVTNVHRVTPRVLFVGSGVAGDVLHQVRRARLEALEFKQQFGHHIPLHLLARKLADAAQLRTQHAATRPLGIASLLLSVEPSEEDAAVRRRVDLTDCRGSDGAGDGGGGIEGSSSDGAGSAEKESEKKAKSSSAIETAGMAVAAADTEGTASVSPQLYRVDPTGQSYRVWATAVGRGAFAAVEWLEKRYRTGGAEAVPKTRGECMQLALRALQLASGTEPLHASSVEVVAALADGRVASYSEDEIAAAMPTGDTNNM